MAHSREVSRVEGFSDAVFGFAVTLLVVSLEVPKSFDELMLAMRGFPAFAICFAILFQVWWRQYRFFRNYDLQDSTIIVLTGFLLFVVLFYVYPLKFLWTLVFSQVVGPPLPEGNPTTLQSPMLFEIYGVGVAAIFGILAAMYWHAYRKREVLGLTALELIDTRIEIYRNVATATIGVVSVAVAAVMSAVAPRFAGLTGFVYFAIGFCEWGIGEHGGRLRKKARA